MNVPTLPKPPGAIFIGFESEPVIVGLFVVFHILKHTTANGIIVPGYTNL